jgi:deoxycytidylate deaminase
MRYKDIKISEPTADDYKWLRLAKHVSEWSLDPSTQTGAVLVNQFNRVVSVDCNRLPDGLDPEILTDRETKLKHIIHSQGAVSFIHGLSCRARSAPRICLIWASQPISHPIVITSAG